MSEHTEEHESENRSYELTLEKGATLYLTVNGPNNTINILTGGGDDPTDDPLEGGG